MSRTGTHSRMPGPEPDAHQRISIFPNRSELVARVEAVAARITSDGLGHSVTVGALTVCSKRRVATWRGRHLALSPRELDILALLARHRGETLSRSFLFQHLWSDEHSGEIRLIDRHIMKLRKKLDDAAIAIQTVRGVGYRLVSP